jgi:hypothetical protein
MSAGRLARIAGGLYLVNILAGAYAIGYVEAAVTNIHAQELLFRSGIAAHVVVTMTNVPLALIFYELFKVVNRRVALLFVFFTLVATAIEDSGIVIQLTAFNFDVANPAYNVSAVFFGGDALAIGYLIYRSTFLPRLIGVLMAIDGVAYIANSFTTFLAPGFASHLVPYIELPTLVGEGGLTLWLLFAGINVARWERVAQEKSQ